MGSGDTAVMENTIRWGILGTGHIAGQFARDLRDADGARLVAVGSRARETAERFGQEFDVPRRHASYEELLADTDVDVVYISTPHTLHAANTIQALDAGKAVLCEKPFTVNAEQARRVIDTARRTGRFCMEAMWTRFLPIHVRLRELLERRAIGTVQMLVADFGIHHDFDPAHRLYDPNLAGGSLLDVGVYPVSLAHMVFGPPTRIAGQAYLGGTGVDERAAIAMACGTDGVAALTCAIRTRTAHEAFLFGSEGQIHLHAPWFRTTTMTLRRGGRDEEAIHLPMKGHGLNYQAEEVGRCLRQDKLESQVMPLEGSLEVMRTLDAIRAQWGLRYPMEAGPA